MFYNLHRNAVIGYKKLSAADLGISRGHTSHIGLYEDTLSFIDGYYQNMVSAQLIYDNHIQEVISYLEPITNEDGSIRSPRIRIGDENQLSSLQLNSVAREIRKITASDIAIDWYVLWFGLESEELVFLLLKENSSDYKQITSLIGNLNKGMITQGSLKFNRVITFLNTKINNLNFTYFEELELLSQVNDGTLTARKKPRRYDIEKAQKIFQEIGRKGEEIVNEHLNRLVYSREIKSFQWMNQNNESGLPFDFEIQKNDGNLFYSDSKATSYRFEQKMIFSSQELQFINQNRNYMIHRVFNINETPQLRVCQNIADITDKFVSNYDKFDSDLQEENLYVNSVKISVPPTNRSLNFYDKVI